MDGSTQRKFFSEWEALSRLMEETGKRIDQIDMNLVKECLYYLYPENEEEDRAYIEKTLPLLHRKLGFDQPVRRVRTSRKRMAVAIAVFLLSIILTATIVAYALGINLLDFFIYGTDEYWMIHVKTPEVSETIDYGMPLPSIYAEVWGEAVADYLATLDAVPVLPTKIPDGYAFVSVAVTDMEGFYEERKFHYEHLNGNSFELILKVFAFDGIDTDSYVEKEEGIQHTVIRDGLEVAVAQNYDSVSATWITYNCYATIVGTCTLEDLTTMINTM